uniref:Uncharacterized protein n=1 Tax=Rhizophora mucronata TaxID=61149 RepID=A0A2P2QSD0_RHIMU
MVLSFLELENGLINTVWYIKRTNQQLIETYKSFKIEHQWELFQTISKLKKPINGNELSVNFYIS